MFISIAALQTHSLPMVEYTFWRPIVLLQCLNSRFLISAITFSKGSRTDPYDGSRSNTTCRVSRSKSTAATVADRSPYSAAPKDMDPTANTPDLNAFATDLINLGDGFDNWPKR